MDKAPTYQYRLKTLNEAVKSFQNSLEIDLSSKDDIAAEYPVDI